MLKRWLSLLVLAVALGCAVPAQAQTMATTNGVVFVRGFQVGAGTFKASGIVCDTTSGTCGCTAFVDAGVINQWNVITCNIPAGILANNGDELVIELDWKTATNADTKAYQFYWNGGTCSGTNANMCTTGSQVFSLSTASSAISLTHNIRVKKTASGTQRIREVTNATTSTQDTSTFAGISVTDTATIPIAFGVRNTSVGEASVGAVIPAFTVRYSPAQ